MRTTIRLNEDLARRARELAIRTGRTFTAVVEDALRQALRGEAPPARASIDLPTMGGQGLQPGVDLDDTASLLELMEDSPAAD